jgi:DMSO/TMAO reductase YedYZ molybdopterin-dependent catalytic subunit
MTARTGIDRRRFALRSLELAALSLLAGCDRLSRAPSFAAVLASAEGLTRGVQRALGLRRAMAREFSDADRSPVFPSNGTTRPGDAEYQALAASAFAGWQLEVSGLVRRPSRFSLEELRRLPSRTQITRHDCVEGWSAIAKWKGVPLRVILDTVGVDSRARYVVFRCADTMDADGSRYYESVDLDDAAHPQTILAYEINDRPLSIEYGAPLRLRVERQLGYKMAKYVMRVELVETLTTIGRGKGGYWEDRGYEWYAGI